LRGRPPWQMRMEFRRRLVLPVPVFGVDVPLGRLDGLGLRIVLSPNARRRRREGVLGLSFTGLVPPLRHSSLIALAVP